MLIPFLGGIAGYDSFAAAVSRIHDEWFCLLVGPADVRPFYFDKTIGFMIRKHCNYMYLSHFKEPLSWSQSMMKVKQRIDPPYSCSQVRLREGEGWITIQPWTGKFQIFHMMWAVDSEPPPQREVGHRFAGSTSVRRVLRKVNWKLIFHNKKVDA